MKLLIILIVMALFGCENSVYIEDITNDIELTIKNINKDQKRIYDLRVTNNTNIISYGNVDNMDSIKVKVEPGITILDLYINESIVEITYDILNDTTVEIR